MIYEMRNYHCVPSHVPTLLQRFEDTTLRIWERLEIRLAGFFTTVVGESNHEFTYFLAWESLDERERKWGQFATDPEWIAARAAHQKNMAKLSAKFLTDSWHPPASLQ